MEPPQSEPTRTVAGTVRMNKKNLDGAAAAVPIKPQPQPTQQQQPNPTTHTRRATISGTTPPKSAPVMTMSASVPMPIRSASTGSAAEAGVLPNAGSTNTLHSPKSNSPPSNGALIPKRVSPTHNLPPLPPMVSHQHFNSGGSLSRNNNNTSATNLYSRTPSTTSLATSFPPPVNASPTPSLVHLAPRPTSPNGHVGYIASPLHGPARSPTVCSCRNEPGSLPCSCSTPIQRPLSLSSSMDGLYSPSHMSRTSSANSTGPGSSISPSPPPSRSRSSFIMPQMYLQSAPQYSQISPRPSAASSISNSTGNSQSSGDSNSPASLSHSLAAAGMVQPSLLPTCPHLGSALEGIDLVATATTSLPHTTSTTTAPPATPPNVVINIYNHTPTTAPPAYSSNTQLDPNIINTSIFSPHAPPDIQAQLQRQPSVSPDYTEAMAITRNSSPSTQPPVGLNSSVSAPILNDSSKLQPSIPGVPLTASTLRMLRKALDVLKSMFPSQEDVTKPPKAVTTSAASSPCTSPRRPMRAAIASPTAATLAAPVPIYATRRNNSCCSPAGRDCSTCGTTASQLPSFPISATSAIPSATKTGCTCFTSPLFCWCHHNLHPICTAPAFTLGSDYIATGHRPVMTAWDCLRSLTQLHNESANIYSHALGSLWMASRWFASGGHTPLKFQAAVSSSLFAISTIAHTFAPMSPEWNQALFQLDRSMISVTESAIGISGAMIHYDQPQQQDKRTALILFNIFLAIAAQKVLLQKSAHHNHSLKVWTLVAQGFFVFLPAFIELAEKTTTPTIRALLKKYVFLSILCGIIGSGFYATFFPESWIYSAEVLENRRRAKEATEAAKAAGLPTPVERLPCSNPQCCVVSPFLTSSTPLTTASSSSAAALSTSPTPFMRFVRWFTDHFLHSHHLMHLFVVVSVHYAWKSHAKWKFMKVALQQANQLATKTIQAS